MLITIESKDTYFINILYKNYELFLKASIFFRFVKYFDFIFEIAIHCPMAVFNL